MYIRLSVAYLVRVIQVRKHTDFPVPEVLAWSSDASNPVGAEYVIMKKAAGVQLFQIWGDISQSDKMELVKRLTILERQLSSIQFPAYGCLYLRSSCPDSSACEPLDRNLDPSESYCVGCSSDRAYVPDNWAGKGNLGPCESKFHSLISNDTSLTN